MIRRQKGVDLTGQRFGKLVAREPHDRLKNGTVRWKCACDCGGEAFVASSGLRNGGTKSCGCLRVESGKARRTHGMTKSPTYLTWKGMIARCTNPKAESYDDYGGRGITVCKRWLIFKNFFADMGERPADRTLDRRNTNGNYEPDNCRWATAIEQANNRRERMTSANLNVDTVIAACKDRYLDFREEDAKVGGFGDYDDSHWYYRVDFLQGLAEAAKVSGLDRIQVSLEDYARIASRITYPRELIA